MKKLAFVFAFGATLALAESWTGTISDGKCGMAHADASEKSQKCAAKCINGGAGAVLVTDGKMVKIANPDAVKEHAGHKVTVTGSMKDDGSIQVSDVKM